MGLQSPLPFVDVSLFFHCALWVLCLWSPQCVVIASMCGCEHRLEALMALYTQTNGPRWGSSSGWGTTTPCSRDWHGVTCNGIQ
jgi:hypothetical protein